MPPHPAIPWLCTQAPGCCHRMPPAVLPPQGQTSLPQVTHGKLMRQRLVGFHSCASASGGCPSGVVCALCSSPPPYALRAGGLWCDREGITQAQQSRVSGRGCGAIKCGGAFPCAWVRRWGQHDCLDARQAVRGGATHPVIHPQSLCSEKIPAPKNGKSDGGAFDPQIRTGLPINQPVAVHNSRFNGILPAPALHFDSIPGILVAGDHFQNVGQASRSENFGFSIVLQGL